MCVTWQCRKSFLRKIEHISVRRGDILVLRTNLEQSKFYHLLIKFLPCHLKEESPTKEAYNRFQKQNKNMKAKSSPNNKIKSLQSLHLSLTVKNDRRPCWSEKPTHKYVITYVPIGSNWKYRISKRANVWLMRLCRLRKLPTISIFTARTEASITEGVYSGHICWPFLITTLPIEEHKRKASFRQYSWVED